MKKIMFIIPFAGGSSQSFAQWDNSEVFSYKYIDLPGKGKNKDMPFLKTMKDMAVFCADYILRVIKNENRKEYYLWGHSMGSYIAYEIVKILKNYDDLLPKMVILTGTTGPDRIHSEELRQSMVCQKAFLEYIVDFGLVNEKICRSRFFLNKFFPAIKNDYDVLLNYHTDKVIISKVRVIVVNGKDDKISYEDAMQWSEYFEEEVHYKWVAGNHFFILNSKNIVEEIYKEINDNLY